MSLPARQVSAPITPNAACAYSPRTTRPLRGLFSPLGMGRPKFTIGWQLSSRPKETRLAAASPSGLPPAVGAHQEARGIGRSLARESGEGLHDPVGHVREGLWLPPDQAAAERTPYSRLLQQTDEVGAPAPILIRQAEGLIEGDVGGDLQLRGGVAKDFVAGPEGGAVG